jgi:hypothetical protein
MRSRMTISTANILLFTAPTSRCTRLREIRARRWTELEEPYWEAEQLSGFESLVPHRRRWSIMQAAIGCGGRAANMAHRPRDASRGTNSAPRGGGLSSW